MAGRRHMHYGEPQLVNSGDSSGSTVTEQISGAFDAFRDAYAAAQEMRDSGFAENDVRICSSPANPDRTPEGSLAQNAAAALGIVQRLLSSLTGGDGRQASRLVRTEDIRRGGVVVSVRVANDNERSIAKAILSWRRAVEIAYRDGGVPIY